jgi:hypothetical protein
MNDLSYVTKINKGNCIDQDNGVGGAPGCNTGIPLPNPNYLHNSAHP